MKYYCEECKKFYDTEREAIHCGERHIEAKRIAEEKAAQKDARWKEVYEAKEKYMELYNNFMNDYQPVKVIPKRYSSPIDVFSDFLF